MGSATSNLTDVLTTVHFYVEIDKVEQAVFTEVSGLSVEVMVQDYEEGGRNDHIHRLPGRVKVSDVILRNGIMTNNALWDWFTLILQGNFDRRSVSIVMVDQKGQQKARWNFISALPVKWTGPELKSGQSTAAIQMLQIAHKGLQITR
jgi:phage tail-like protein